MHIIVLTYTADLGEINAAIGDHAAWLERNYADRVFLASGRRVPRTGGVILAADVPLEDLHRRLAEDPFSERGLASYSVTTFVPSKTRRRARRTDSRVDRHVAAGGTCAPTRILTTLSAGSTNVSGGRSAARCSAAGRYQSCRRTSPTPRRRQTAAAAPSQGRSPTSSRY